MTYLNSTYELFGRQDSELMLQFANRYSQAERVALVQLAENIATEAHRDQKRNNGDPYITHPRRVAAMLEGFEAKVVGWLHDVIEDTKIKHFDLINLGIPQVLAHDVVMVTRFVDQSYADFIDSIANHPMASYVKLADLEDNKFDLQPGSLRDKYELATMYIKSRYHGPIPTRKTAGNEDPAS